MTMIEDQKYERYSRMISWRACGNDGLNSVDVAFCGLKQIVHEKDLKYIIFNGKSISAENFLAFKLSKQARYRSGIRLTSGRGHESDNLLISYGSVEPYDRVGSKTFNSSLNACYLAPHDEIIKKHILPVITTNKLIFSWQIQWPLQIKNQALDVIKQLGMEESQYGYFRDSAGYRSIDHYNSPFRIFNRRAVHTEAIGSEMWFGPDFWMKTAANPDDLYEIEGIQISTLPNKIVYIKTDREFRIGDEQVQLADALRRCLFPHTWFLDQFDKVRVEGLTL